VREVYIEIVEHVIHGRYMEFKWKGYNFIVFCKFCKFHCVFINYKYNQTNNDMKNWAI
jgi:pyruvate-formate lyase-activating enzyme